MLRRWRWKMNNQEQFIPNQSELLSGDDKKYIRIPMSILSNKDLSHLEKLVWGRLALYAGDDGNCYPSITQIADSLGSSEKGIKKALTKLKNKGFINWDTPHPRQRRKDKKANDYYFYWHESLNCETGEQSTPVSKEHSTQETREQSTYQNKSLENKSIKTTTTEPEPNTEFDNQVDGPTQEECCSSKDLRFWKKL